MRWKRLWQKFLFVYFWLSLLIGFVSFLAIYSIANDLTDLSGKNYLLLQENRELKKKVWRQQSMGLPEKTAPVHSEKVLITAPKNYQESLVTPTVASENFVEPNNQELLVPYSEKIESNNESNNKVDEKKIEICGSSKNVYLGDLYLINYLKPAMDNVKIVNVEPFKNNLPGANREHRGGWHQGLDHYTGDCGTFCVHGTPVKAIYSGKIIRIDSKYEELTYSEVDNIYCKLKDIGSSDVDIDYDEEYQLLFDKVRGRQVVIDHENGLVSAYCHLSAVNNKLQVGDVVKTGDIIGNLGNSGTLKGAEDNEDKHVKLIELKGQPEIYFLDFIAREWHLHLELWFSEKGANDPNLKIKWLNWESWKKVYGY
jgi:murein DD-endopeptidase MepM/ murein hydrolase activator NlpD